MAILIIIKIIHSWRIWRISEETFPIKTIDEYSYFLSSFFGNTLTGKELYIIYNSKDADLVLTIPLEN